MTGENQSLIFFFSFLFFIKNPMTPSPERALFCTSFERTHICFFSWVHAPHTERLNADRKRNIKQNEK